jgi:hypothetical protein
VGTQKICQEQRRQKQNNDGTLPAWTPGLLDAVWEQPSVLTAPLLLNFEFFFSQLTTRENVSSNSNECHSCFFGISGRCSDRDRIGPGRKKGEQFSNLT